jgi:SNF2 family DNA or RNA helicase
MPSTNISTTQRSQNYLQGFDSKTLLEGRDYFSRNMVSSLYINDDDEIYGLVRGSGKKLYETTIVFSDDLSGVAFTVCSCSEFDYCKHAVALLLAFVTDFAGEQFSTLEGQFKAPSTKSSELQRQLQRIATTHENLKQEAQSRAQTSGWDSNSNAQSKQIPRAKTALIYVIENNEWTKRPSITQKTVSLRKNGTLGAERPFYFDRLMVDSQPPAYALKEDFEIARLWYAVESFSARYSQTSSSNTTLNQLLDVLFTLVLNTGRCYYDQNRTQPLKLGERLKGVLNWEQTADDKYRPSIALKDYSAKYICLRWNYPWYVDLDNWICGPVNIDLPPTLLTEILSLPKATEDEISNVPVILSDLGISHLIPPPPGTKTIQIKLIAPLPKLGTETLKTTVPIANGNSVIHTGENIQVLTLDATFPESKPNESPQDSLICVKNDLDALALLPAKLKQKGFKEISKAYFSTNDNGLKYFIASEASSWLELDAEAIHELRSEGWDVSKETEKAIQPTDLNFNDLALEISEEDNWWFSLSLNIDVNGKKIALLPVLVAAIRELPASAHISENLSKLNHQGKFIARLTDGSMITLPFERIRSILISLDELIQHRGSNKSINISLLHATELLQDETLSNANWIGAHRITELATKLKKLSQIEIVEPPKKFGTQLRPYQQEGLSWLQFLAENNFGGILADDMGLGKTVQLLAHICLQKEQKRLQQPFLVVCPTSVLPNWGTECQKFAPQLKIVEFHGSNRAALAKSLPKADLVITTYPILMRDIEKLSEIKWHGLALDEAQAIKNATTKLAQAARKLKAGYRFCLSGTPVENHLGELWSQFQFILPGLLGDQGMFKECYRDPIEKEGNLERKKSLASRIRPFLLRRTKQEVAKELPDKTVIVQQIDLESAQRELYETVRLAATKKVRDEIADKGFKQSQILILDALLKLRQVCCDPRLVKLTAAAKVKQSAKLQELLEMLEQLTQEGRKILVFSQFTSMLNIIAQELTVKKLPFVTITGDTKDRKTPVDKFQNGSEQIFLISLKAGGTGLNLTAADVVIHYDPWWNPAVEEQATDRAHRIGQTKKVFVYKLIAQGTIEQRMLELQDRKRILAGSIYDSQGNVSLAFSEKDLEALLSPMDSN